MPLTKGQWKQKRLTTPAANGGSWIQPDLREAIYRRDGRTCVYCGAVEDGAIQLTLDHKTPPSRYKGKFYANHPTNLVTACLSCNSSKGDATMPEYVIRIGKPELDSIIRNRLRKSWQKQLDAIRFERRLAAAVQERLDQLTKQCTIVWTNRGDDDVPF